MSDTIDDNEGWEWAVVEIFGHTRHAGRTREEEKLGAKMLRIDVPVFQLIRGIGEISPTPLRWETCWYSPSAIFSLRLTDEATVMKANKPYVSPYRITHLSEEEAQSEP